LLRVALRRATRSAPEAAREINAASVASSNAGASMMTRLRRHDRRPNVACSVLGNGAENSRSCGCRRIGLRPDPTIERLEQDWGGDLQGEADDDAECEIHRPTR
jgi:hypothetical protein